MKFLVSFLLFAVSCVFALQPAAVKEASLLNTNAAVKSSEPTSVWYAHHDTVYHTKVPNIGYVEGDTKEKTSPYYDPKTKIPVSTTMKCIMNMAIQYFIVYTMLAVLRTLRQLNNNPPPSKNLLTWTAATGTVAFVPMLSCLFLGVRMRAVQLSQNQTEKYKLPQDWVQGCMELCSLAILIQVVLVLIVPVVTGKAPETDADGNLIVSQDPQQKKSSTFAMVATACRFVAMAALYGGMVIVSVGAFVMKGPKEIWGDDVPPVSPAVFVTMNMCYLYFFIYAAMAVLRALNNPAHRNLLGLFNICAFCVNLAPMLCVLFIGARMRALQMDPLNGAPQAWAQNCFYLCMWSLYIQCALVLLVGGFIGGEVKKGECEGDVVFENIGNPTIFSFISAVRWILLLALYGGLLAVVISVLIIEHPKGKEHTPPLSTAMICVMNLTVQYFFVYLMLYVFITLRQFAGSHLFIKTLKTFDAARGTVMFCPMLSLLFIGLRMRALQITGGAGAPPGWAQDCMFLATWSVLLQLLLCLCLPCVTGAEVGTDEDGNVGLKSQKTTGIGYYLLEGFRYTCMLSMYGGSCGVCAAVFLMTPATANGKDCVLCVPAPVNVQEVTAETAAAAPEVEVPKVAFF